jgi:hypothetical protein
MWSPSKATRAAHKAQRSEHCRQRRHCPRELMPQVGEATCSCAACRQPNSVRHPHDHKMVQCTTEDCHHIRCNRSSR